MTAGKVICVSASRCEFNDAGDGEARPWARFRV